MPVLAESPLAMSSTELPAAKASFVSYTPLNIPPEGWYDYNRLIFSPAIPRCSLWRIQPFDIVFVTSAATSYNVSEVISSAGLQAFIKLLQRLRESLPAVKHSRVGLVYLCSIPNLPGQQVVECDSTDPVTAENVACNFADLGDMLVSASTRYIPVGQAACNVLQRYEIPGPLVDEPDFFVLDLQQLAAKIKD